MVLFVGWGVVVGCATCVSLISRGGFFYWYIYMNFVYSRLKSDNIMTRPKNKKNNVKKSLFLYVIVYFFDSSGFSQIIGVECQKICSSALIVGRTGCFSLIFRGGFFYWYININFFCSRLQKRWDHCMCQEEKSLKSIFVFFGDPTWKHQFYVLFRISLLHFLAQKVGYVEHYILQLWLLDVRHASR